MEKEDWLGGVGEEQVWTSPQKICSILEKCLGDPCCYEVAMGIVATYVL